MRRGEAAGPSLAFWALKLAPEFPAAFGAATVEMRRFQMSFRALSTLPFRKAVWLLPLCWTLHEAEEWNIMDWFQRYWVNVPEITSVEMRTGLVFMSLIGVIGTACTLVLRSPRVTALLALPFFAVLALGNALQHVYWVFAFQAYSPGVVTSVLLVIPGIVYLTLRAVRDHLIPRWYAALIFLPAARSVYFAVQDGNAVPEAVHGLTGLFATLARLAGVP